MLFTEPLFALFYLVVFLIYWKANKNGLRKNILLFASYIFYGAWDWRFAVMLFGLSTTDYAIARAIARSEERKFQKILVASSIAMNLGVLAMFKYLNFFIGSTVSVARALNFELDQPTINLVLPIGISFFTFQSLSYTIDVFRKEITPARSLRDYLLFAAFFPQLVAGPIVRPRKFLPQLNEIRFLSATEMRAALLLFTIGFFKKMCVADNISPFVDEVFANPAKYDLFSCLTASWLYSTQIYCDFSGYSDMAIAVSALLGYKLTKNFDAPYLATTIREFWRRWHISLSSWIRDYIYISLGGRAESKLKTYRNLMLTMLAGGLWHGAAWTFVAWGGAHGFGQVVHGEFRRVDPERSPKGIRAVLSWFLTLNFVVLAWILFRASSFSIALEMIQSYLFITEGGPLSLPHWLALLPLGLLMIQDACRRSSIFSHLVAGPTFRFYFLLGVTCSVIIAFLPFGYRPFIYFQF